MKTPTTIEEVLNYLEEASGQKARMKARVLELLTTLYTQEDRAYHNLSHIEHCLRELGELKHLNESFDELLFAIIFHDVIYDSKADDNEVRSAEEAATCLNQLGWSAFFDESKIRSYILATDHKTEPSCVDYELFRHYRRNIC